MERKVYAAKCKACGALCYPTHFYCPKCGKSAFEPVPITGGGKLVTWTRAYALSLDYAQRYLTLGIVELDMGIRATGQLAIDVPVTGMRVRSSVGVVREIEGNEVHGLVFVEA